MSTRNLIIGIDGGGSKTRVAISDTMGNLLAYHESPKAASRYKDQSAKENVHRAIHLALAEAGGSPSEVCGIAAGVAGFDRPEDLEWVQELTNLTVLSCSRWHVNDAVVAHYGAHLTKPGIVVIAGTGSILFGINEMGKQMRNYDYHHYAYSAARFLSYDAVYEVLAGHTDPSDQELIKAMLNHWGATDVDQLNHLGLKGFHTDNEERLRMFSSFAPVLTNAALEGSPLAQSICNRAIYQIVVGIKILARNFLKVPVSAACIGSVVNSQYFRLRLGELSLHQSDKIFDLTDVPFPPAIGALLYAFEQLDIPITDAVVSNLSQSLPESC